MKVRIKDIAEVINGSTPSTQNPEYYDGDIIWITPKDLSDQNSKYIYSGERSITQAGYNSCSTKMIPENNILMSSRAPIGLLAINKVECCTNQGFKSLIVDKTKCNVEYLYYYLKYHIKEIESLGSGTTFKEVSKDSMEKYEIVLPSIKVQETISNVLSLLDNKIINNNKINDELESMAKTLYNYWFLQFDFPNENGKPYKSSGGKMVWNEELKREIPEGWKVDNLIESSLCEDIKAGVDYFETKNYLPTANINGEEITDGDYITFNNRESRANMQPVKNSVWFAKMKNSIKHLTIPENSDWFISKYILSTGFQGLKCSADSLAYIHCLINSDWFEKYKDVLSHGATQESVNNEDLKNIKFAVPTQEILKRFAEIVNPIIEKKFQIIKENQELVSLRDFLLPLLMNGQVKFKDN